MTHLLLVLRVLGPLSIGIFGTVQGTAQSTARSTAPAVVQDGAGGAAKGGYKHPPEAIGRAALAPPPPAISVAPDGAHVVLVHREAMPTIAEMARPMVALAGIRIDPARKTRQDTGGRSFGLSIVSVADGGERQVALPADADVSSPVWAADGSRFAFTNATDDGLEVFVCEVASARARRIDGVRVTDVLGAPIDWMPDQQRLLVKLWPGGVLPPAPAVPPGPNVQETSGRVAPVRTFQDLLETAYDEDLFEHLARSRLAIVDPAGGDTRFVGAPALHAQAEPSPDGRYLLVTRIVRPFSYLVTSWSFPKQVIVVDLAGEPLHHVADLPLADGVPIGGVPLGPRQVEWLPGEAASLVWAEALDGGDPKAKVAHRDAVFVCRIVARPPEPAVEAAAPRAAARQWFKTEYRFSGLSFGERGELAFATTRDRERRWTRSWMVFPRQLERAPELWHERAQRDAYGDLGDPVTTLLPNGERVFRRDRDGSAVFLHGSGATPGGARPFLRRVDVATKATKELFRAAAGRRYERVVAMLAVDGSRLLVSRESPTEPPNLFVIGPDGGERQLTRFVDAQQELVRGIGRKFLRYRRADGVELSATLYTPPGYEAGTRLPTLVWAYPREFVSADTAGQVRGSPHRYERLAGTSHLLMLLAGYAVLDDATMPIVGPKETANDTFVEQLVADARAAVEAAVAEGVADPERMAIAGHSYGAFMTANLLAHSGLFRAGIARSGAYNRTLTPFGFQNERRTYWEAPEIYFSMSPFMHAPKIDEPVLIIHGEVDNNSGTFPVQSHRLYHAIKGHGGTARLVILPHESHGYRAKESVLHVLSECVEWLETHVRGGGDPGSTRPGASTR